VTNILEDFMVPFVSILVAEFGDKSQMALFLLSARTRMHKQLLAGAFLAFLVVDGIAILAGYYILNIIPVQVVRFAGGAVFAAVGIFYLLRRPPEEKESARLVSPFYSGFAVTFFSEWGDKTQLASGLLATKFVPFFVLSGVLASLFLLSYLAVRSGKLIHARVDRKVMQKISGAIFIVLGITFIIG